MRRLSLTIAMALVLPTMPVLAQPAQQNPTDLMVAERGAMQAFAWMDGEWRGTAVTQTPTGEHRVTHTERAGLLLGGTIRLIEGHSYRPDGTTGFNAFAMLSYDPSTKTYRMTSHAEGRYGSFAIVPQATGYIWQIRAGPMTIRYTATLTDGVWTEIGERLFDGKEPVQFFRMELRRVGESVWPGAGAVSPK
jgi:hypothetical protein